MITSPCALLLAMTLVAGCSSGSSRPSLLVGGLDDAPASVREACELAARKCVRCHTVNRIVRMKPVSPVHWQRYVTRMRMQPNSGIGPAEGQRITDCLVYRSFGREGLARLRAGGPSE